VSDDGISKSKSVNGSETKTIMDGSVKDVFDDGDRLCQIREETRETMPHSQHVGDHVLE
jgi:hypothetical protein